nr:multidrug effflux MFS transporter [Streptomyces sp. RPA4-2]
MKTASTRTPYALLLAVLCSLNAGGLFASDINLPGVPATAHAFHTPVASVQWTFSAFMIGIAVSQAVYGPVSDAYGRKGVIVSGLGLFVVASLVCAVAPTVEVFGAGRLLQALGAGSGMVLGRAVISDLYEERDAARMFATVMPIVGVSPSVAPLVGGYLTTYVSWRAAFVVTALLGLVTLVVMITSIPESLPPERRSKHLGTTLRGYPKLLTRPLFWAYTINLAVAYGGYFGYLAASPLVFEKMGLATQTTSYCYITVSIAYVAGNLTSRTLVRARPVDRLLWMGHGFFLAGALMMLGLGLSGVRTLGSAGPGVHAGDDLRQRLPAAVVDECGGDDFPLDGGIGVRPDGRPPVAGRLTGNLPLQPTAGGRPLRPGLVRRGRRGSGNGRLRFLPFPGGAAALHSAKA